MAAMTGMCGRLVRSVRFLPASQGRQTPVSIRFVSPKLDVFLLKLCSLYKPMDYLCALEEGGCMTDLQLVYGLQSAYN